MADILATTGAITTATRLTKHLEKLGCINARVVHTPSEIATGGCSYSVKMSEDCLANLKNLQSAGMLKIRKIYRERISNEERVYDDIS